MAQIPAPPKALFTIGPGVPDWQSVIAQALMSPGMAPFMQLPQAQTPGQAPMQAPVQPGPAQSQMPAFPGNALTQPLMDPNVLKAMEGRAADLKGLSDKANDRYNGINSEFLSGPSPQQSPFEQQMSDGLRDRIVKLLAGSDNSKMSRFGRGAELGQQIAANFIVPLMGAFSHTPGGAMGAAAATEMLQQRIAQEKAQKAQQESAHNSMIANLSQIYQNLDPKSSKNLLALATQKFQTNKYNSELKNQAFKDAIEAAQKASDAQKDVLTAKTKANSDDSNRQIEGFRAKVQAANVQSEMGKRGADLDNKSKDLQNDADRIKLGRDALNEKTDNDQKGRTLQTDQMRQSAQNQLAMRLGQFRRDLFARNEQGQPNFPGLGEYVKNNPAEIESMRNLFKNAGLTNTTPEKMLSSIAEEAKQPQAQAGGGFDPMKLIQSFLPGGTPLGSAPQAAPAQAQQADPTGFAKTFKLSDTARHAVKSKDYRPAMSEAAAGFEKAYGRKPTPPELQHILKEMP